VTHFIPLRLAGRRRLIPPRSRASLGPRRLPDTAHRANYCHTPRYPPIHDEPWAPRYLGQTLARRGAAQRICATSLLPVCSSTASPRATGEPPPADTARYRHDCTTRSSTYEPTSACIQNERHMPRYATRLSNRSCFGLRVTTCLDATTSMARRAAARHFDIARSGVCDALSSAALARQTSTRADVERSKLAPLGRYHPPAVMFDVSLPR